MYKSVWPRKVASALAVVIALFQVGLAAGLPWGAAAYGGSHPGVLPANLRLISVVAAITWSGVAVLARLAADRHRLLLRGVAGICVVGGAMNLASRNLPEIIIWVPIATTLAVALWQLSTRGNTVSQPGQ